MQSLALVAPFFLGEGIKIVYDLLVSGPFRGSKPEEERASVRAVPKD